MNHQFKDWLAVHAAGNRGGVARPDLAITRGREWTARLALTGDFTADTLFGSIGLEPNDGVSEVADFSVVAGAFSGGETAFDFTLSAAQTATIPADADGDGLLWLPFDISREPLGAAPYIILSGVVPVQGSVGGA